MSEEIKEGYKVVRKSKISGSLASAFQIGGKWVLYEIGKKAYPKKDCNSLFVFEREVDALAFEEEQKIELKIYKCRFKPAVQDFSFVTDPYVSWGTVLADWVELVEEVCV
jgi:hypothetical protein